MSTISRGSYYLRWRGRQEGPLSVDDIRARLAEGTVGLLHEVLGHNGQWVALGDFLRTHEREGREQQEADARRQREEQQRRIGAQKDAALQDAQRENEALAGQVEDLQRQAASRPSAPPPPPPGMCSPAYPVAAHRPGMPPPPPGEQRTSGMAIAAFVMAMLNFVPFLNFVSWVLALIFGHIAISHIDSTPGLGGRGLARAALTITYFLLVLGFVYGLLYAIAHSGR